MKLTVKIRERFIVYISFFNFNRRWIVLFCLLFPCVVLNQNSWDLLIQEGIHNYSKGEFKKAIQYFKNAEQEASLANDSFALQVIHTNLGNAYSLHGIIESSLASYQKAADIALIYNDSVNLSKITKNIGTLYSDQQDFEEALEYFNKAEKIARSIGEEDVLADCEINKAIIYEQLHDYDKALKLYEQALVVYESKDNKERMALAYNNLGILLKQLGRYEESINYYQKTLEIAKSLEENFIVAATLTNLANVYMMVHKFELSIDLNHQALKLANEIEAPTIASEVYGNLSDVYSKQQNWKKAYEYAQLYKVSSDSIFNSERSLQLTEMREKYESEKKEAENSDLKSTVKIKDFEIQKNKLLIQQKNIFILASVVLLTLLIVFAYLYYLWQKERNKLAHEEAVLQTERRERKRIAQDLHDDLGAGLTKIKYLTNNAFETRDDTQLKSNILLLSDTASELINNMRDMVWALTPENTTISYLISRMRSYALDYFDKYPIQLSFIGPEKIVDFKITAKANRNIYLIFKECLQNIVKHASASEVHIEIQLDSQQFSIRIRDNGVGLKENVINGNGISNIQRRAKDILGEVEFVSTLKEGVEVVLCVSVNKLRA